MYKLREITCVFFRGFFFFFFINKILTYVCTSLQCCCVCVKLQVHERKSYYLTLGDLIPCMAEPCPEILTNAWPIPNWNDRYHAWLNECMVAPLWDMKWWLFNGLTCNLRVTAVCRFVSLDVSFDPTSRSETTNWM